MTDQLVLPEGSRFGVATAGYQVEGHYSAPDAPKNNRLYTDSVGDDAAGTCRRLVEGLRDGDLAVLSGPAADAGAARR